MYTFLALLFAAALPSLLSAQYNLSTSDLERVPTLALPLQDNTTLLATEKLARKAGRAERFAVALPVTVRPSTHGQWTEENGLSVWRIRLHSPGAKTINLGFSEYNLPEGAELFLLSPEEKYGPFTAADNEEHNQLWTPLLEGDELIIELQVPTALKKRVQLYLTAVNHDFQGVTKFLSGSCNLDVICGEADGWGIVDGYRDIIRSVAAYTINGTDVCTGFLVNNANQDGTPYFMTANHCNVRANNAPALVAYWNFQSPECRQPGSTASGQLGFGNRNIFNSGAIHLASFASSDVTITRLDDAVNPAANAFFAGWDANEALPSDTVVAVHHPGVDEKRISFSFNQTYRVNNGGGNQVNDGNLLEVPDWSIGTTEGGSSGSPIFDVTGHVRGQLFGGQAACGNDDYDVYGYFAVSWEGGGTPETRLKDWLDPCGTGTLRIEGMEYDQIVFNLTADNYCNSICAGGTASTRLTAGEGYVSGGTVSLGNSSSELEVTVIEGNVQAGEAFDVIVTAPTDLASGIYSVTIGISSDTGSDEVQLNYIIEGSSPAAPNALGPADSETDVNPVVTLSWEALGPATGYDLQLSTQENFSSVTLAREDITQTDLPVAQSLEPNTTYFWRIRTINNCSTGEWATYSFTTANLSCGTEEAGDLPVTITESGTPTVTSSIQSNAVGEVSGMEVRLRIDHSYVGDLDADLTSPDGTTIQLFAPVRNGNCGGANMDLVFSDEAAATHDDFTSTCTLDDVTTSGIFQPAEPFSIFAGESAAGEWTLTVRDAANVDGGAITSFSINFCSESPGTDLRVESSTSGLDICQNEITTVSLLLGSGIIAEPTVNVLADGIPVSTSTNFLPGNQLITISIPDWQSLDSGNYTLEFRLTLAGGVSRIVSIPLSLSEELLPPALSEPTDGIETPEGPLTFAWSAEDGAVGYNLQVSAGEDFSALLLNESVNGTSFTWNGTATGELFWRVRALNNCGTFSSITQSLTIKPNGLQGFGQGRSLSVYPNPVKGQLTIEAIGNWPNSVQVGLYDAAGRYVSGFQLNGTGRTQWDLGGLAAGMYYLRLHGAGQQRTERIVVLP